MLLLIFVKNSACKINSKISVFVDNTKLASTVKEVNKNSEIRNVNNFSLLNV